MNRFFMQGGLIIVLGLFASCKKDRPVPHSLDASSPVYHLNIIGKPSEKKNDDYQGARLFVLRNGTTKVWLQPGNGPYLSSDYLSDNSAILYLPAADADQNGYPDYRVTARPLATPGGMATVKLCATETATGKTVCSETYYAVRSKGTPQSTDITDMLFYLSADLNHDNIREGYPVFHPAFKNYHLRYENNGLKLLQISFYR